ncbi:MAG: phosphomannomutase/phosphoglucomutase [Patescibacteria group bacterium]|nr:phosphomannomutase/phosphoglucomutase [Patescibacteria group bacterium]
MSIDPSIFKAYDIRGLSPEQVDEDVAFRIGQALVKFTEAKRIAVSRDMRTTTPMLFDAMTKGIMSLGCDVVDLGMLPTPVHYFGVCEYDDIDAGAIVTASHNPAEYNGMKLCTGDALQIGAVTGMPEIRDIAMEGPHDPVSEPGRTTSRDIKEDYLKRLLAEVDLDKFKPMKLVADTGNGMEGVIIEDVLSKVPGLEYEVMFKELDGNFPNHEANPIREETLEALKARVVETGADIGVAFDGDGDRVGIVDEKGDMVRGDLFLSLIVPIVLKRYPGTAVVYDVRQGMTVVEEIEKHGGRPVMAIAGTSYIKSTMRKEGAAVGGEMSNHFFFKSMCTAESSDLAILMVMQLMSETGRPLSDLVQELKRYQISGEINFTIEDKDAVMAGLEEKYRDRASDVIKIDGLRMEFFDKENPADDWFFSIRASNTEPLLRLNVEAKNKAKMEQMRDELVALIRG